MVLVLLAGCSTAELVVTPASVPMSGYVPVSLDLSGTSIDAGDVLAVTAGGMAAYDLCSHGPDVLELHVQGARTPGGADLVLATAEGEHRFAGALTYEPNADASFDRFVALGYAMVANLFLDAFEAELGLSLERVDLAEVVPTDPYAPSAMRAEGVDPSNCLGGL